MNLSKVRVFPVLTLVAAIVSACGSDSSGPGSGGIDSNAALQSLSLGLQGVALGSPTTPEANATFGGIAPQLDQVTVTLDGASQGMFALGLRESFPAGTCEETLFVNSFPSPPGVCTPPQLQVAVILWQAHSATQPPDRMIFIVTDVGTSNFDFESAPADATPGIALFMEGTSDVWSSLSGTITSQTTSTNQTCSLTLPPYAKSGTCTFATFSEQGSIVFEPFSLNVPSTQRKNLVIPSTSLHGLWIAISEVQSVPLTGNRLVPVQSLAQRVLAQSVASRLAAPPTRAR
jgi:hypothetical protein